MTFQRDYKADEMAVECDNCGYVSVLCCSPGEEFATIMLEVRDAGYQPVRVGNGWRHACCRECANALRD